MHMLARVRSWAERLSQLRADIDALISVCDRTPIGFYFLGFLITPKLLQVTTCLLSRLHL